MIIVGSGIKFGKKILYFKNILIDNEVLRVWC